MQYKEPTTILRGYLTPSSTATVKLIVAEYDKTTKEYASRLVETSTTECIECSVCPGLYYFSLENITEDIGDTLEIAYIMEDSENEVYGGKIVIDNSLFGKSEQEMLLNAFTHTFNIESAMKGGWELLDDGTVNFFHKDETIFAKMKKFNKDGHPSPFGSWKLMPYE